MIAFTLASLAGITSLQFLPHLPNIWVLGAIVIILCLFLFWEPIAKWILSFFSLSYQWDRKVGTKLSVSKKSFRKAIFCSLFLVFGMIWMQIQVSRVSHWSLNRVFEGKSLLIRGEIASLPEIKPQYMSFLFNLKTVENKPHPALIKLVWFAPYPNVGMGELWELHVHLKQPHGLVNPGGFDYEKWLFAHKIRATGNVVNREQNQKLSRATSFHFLVNRTREYFERNIRSSLAQDPMTGFIEALSIGVQNQITPQQWSVLRSTGTNHLMAIAGVHIGFVSGFIYFISKLIWRHMPWTERIPSPQAGAIMALIASITYSALAGFSLPTQRALMMMSIFLFAQLCGRYVRPWRIFFAALGVILIWDPLCTMAASFWLSFAAVAAILFGMNGRLHPQGIWWKWGRIQWIIMVALIPLSLIFFQQTSLVSFMANMIAVPAVGILVLPFCLLGTLLLPILDRIGHFLIWLAAKIMHLIWLYLVMLSHFHFAAWKQVMPSIWVLIASLIAVCLILMPRGFYGRYLAGVWFFPLFFYKAIHPKAGEFWLTVLDVGQGLSVVVQTAQHVLIYDTGPKIEGFDAGEAVVAPFLYTLGLSQVDMLLISHGDNDHSGGAPAILEQFNVKRILTSSPELFDHKNPNVCQRNQTWEWDGVRFTILYPPPTLLHLDNNSSCVLRIENVRHSVLLTGDIEKLAEEYLIKNKSPLFSELLIAPHHGSKTSSTVGFLEKARPQYVFFSIGYLNRYHFPSPVVLKRYQRIQSKLYDTTSSGAITIRLGLNEEIKIYEMRKQMPRFWRSG